jgi:hypothetical protein
MKLSKDEHEQLWYMIRNQAKTSLLLLPIDRLRMLQEDLSESETMAPIFDPTFYRNNINQLEISKKLLEITIEYARKLNDLKIEVEKKGIDFNGK